MSAALSKIKKLSKFSFLFKRIAVAKPPTPAPTIITLAFSLSRRKLEPVSVIFAGGRGRTTLRVETVACQASL